LTYTTDLNTLLVIAIGGAFFVFFLIYLCVFYAFKKRCPTISVFQSRNINPTNNMAGVRSFSFVDRLLAASPELSAATTLVNSLQAIVSKLPSAEILVSAPPNQTTFPDSGNLTIIPPEPKKIDKIEIGQPSKSNRDSYMTSILTDDSSLYLNSD
jgi:hypothetical protein